ncbi:hypothetical protein E4U42_001581 [Claviceps africana]|uniref:Uncharacterized protein n=1 Tax=Claviceps africana TaxID=83212 RepID=A0A8K0JAH0_9HYPO|nr:hypothetical protein E4U42_001581 [Claviceps africana]
MHHVRIKDDDDMTLYDNQLHQLLRLQTSIKSPGRTLPVDSDVESSQRLGLRTALET